ncbi:hypothetical protein D3C84_864060 [compost metagenome]
MFAQLKLGLLRSTIGKAKRKSICRAQERYVDCLLGHRILHVLVCPSLATHLALLKPLSLLDLIRSRREFVRVLLVAWVERQQGLVGRLLAGVVILAQLRELGL